MKARRSRTVFGGVQEERAAIRWGDARIETGEIIVFLAERRRSHLSRAVRTFLQLDRRSIGGVATAVDVISDFGDTAILEEVT
jgi:hypothetical protein